MTEDLPRWVREEVVASTFADAARLYDDVCWHDSVVYRVALVRERSADQVIVDARLLYDWEKQASCLAQITLDACFRVEAKMNWGIGCMSDGEMIGSVDVAEADPLIDSVRAEWPRRKLGSLFRFRIELSSTGSLLDVVCGRITIRAVAEPGAHTAPPPLLPGTTIPDPE